MNASQIVLLAIGSAAITIACGGEPTSVPGAAGAGTAAQSATPPTDKGDDDGETDAGADAGDPMFACGSGVSCVAVGRVNGCCYNGWKIAVAEDQVEAYKNATACTGKRPICPMYIVRDTRVAACNATTRTCEMVAPGESDAPQ